MNSIHLKLTQDLILIIVTSISGGGGGCFVMVETDWPELPDPQTPLAPA